MLEPRNLTRAPWGSFPGGEEESRAETPVLPSLGDPPDDSLVCDGAGERGKVDGVHCLRHIIEYKISTHACSVVDLEQVESIAQGHPLPLAPEMGTRGSLFSGPGGTAYY